MTIATLIKKYEETLDPETLCQIYVRMAPRMHRFLNCVLEEGLTVDGDFVAEPTGDEQLIDQVFVQFAIDTTTGESTGANQADLIGRLEDLLIDVNRQARRLENLTLEIATR